MKLIIIHNFKFIYYKHLNTMFKKHFDNVINNNIHIIFYG